jgi:hypothetical protein
MKGRQFVGFRYEADWRPEADLLLLTVLLLVSRLPCESVLEKWGCVGRDVFTEIEGKVLLGDGLQKAILKWPAEGNPKQVRNVAF